MPLAIPTLASARPPHLHTTPSEDTPFIHSLPTNTILLDVDAPYDDVSSILLTLSGCSVPLLLHCFFRLLSGCLCVVHTLTLTLARFQGYPWSLGLRPLDLCLLSEATARGKVPERNWAPRTLPLPSPGGQ